jgi:hypothetical protein
VRLHPPPRWSLVLSPERYLARRPSKEPPPDPNRSAPELVGPNRVPLIREPLEVGRDPLEELPEPPILCDVYRSGIGRLSLFNRKPVNPRFLRLPPLGPPGELPYTFEMATRRHLKDEGKPTRDPREAAMPAISEPQLATLVKAPPSRRGWIHELKLDGYRLLVRFDGRKAQIDTRAGNDWTETFPAVAAAAEQIGRQPFLIDGETVVVDRHGRSSFGALQEHLSVGKGAVTFFAFDLLCLGADLRKTPLLHRKETSAPSLRSPHRRRRSPTSTTSRAKARPSSRRHAAPGSRASSASARTSPTAPAARAPG